MNVFRAELARFRHRRLLTRSALVAVVVVAGAGFLTFRSHDGAPPDMALAAETAAQVQADCLASYAGDPSVGPEEVEQWCYVEVEWFLLDNGYELQGLLGGDGDMPWAERRAVALERVAWSDGSQAYENPASGFDGTLSSFAFLAVLVAGLLAAASMGGDWRSGIIESQLIRTPYRRRLLTAKIAATSVTTSLFAVTTSALFVAAMLPSAIWRGDASNTGGAFWVDVGWLLARVGVAATVVSVLTASVALIGRSTAVGTVALLASVIVGGIVEQLELRWAMFVVLPQNLKAWLVSGDVTHMVRRPLPGGGEEIFQVASHTWLLAGLVLLCLGAVTVSVGGALFQRRDVA